jgi:hypothetical protein
MNRLGEWGELNHDHCLATLIHIQILGFIQL